MRKYNAKSQVKLVYFK
ncbi:TPA: hypothetical protein ACS5O1_003134 [Escherichia coli]